jgi:hypothetical protein
MARVLLCHDPANPKPVLDIALSERNLIVLLSKLYTPGSACELINGDVPAAFAYARFRSEPDELHYAFPTRNGAPPGRMHPVAEAALVAVRDTIARLSRQPDGPGDDLDSLPERPDTDDNA